MKRASSLLARMSLLALLAATACAEGVQPSLGRYTRLADFPLYFLSSSDGGEYSQLFVVTSVASGTSASGELLLAGLPGASSLAADTAGQLYMTHALEAPLGKLSRYDTASASLKQIIVDLSYPTAVTVDSFNQAYVLENGRSRVLRLSGAGRLQNLAESGIESPEVGTMDGSDNIYLTTAGSNDVARLTPDGQLSWITTGSQRTVLAVALDPSGILHLLEVDAATETGQIWQVLADGERRLVLYDLVNPTAMAFDSSGALYVGEGAPAYRISRLVAGEEVRRAVVNTEGEVVAIAFTPY